MLLIISENEYLSSNMSDTLRYIGVLSYGVKPAEASEEISDLYSAVLMLEDSTSEKSREAIFAVRRKTVCPIFGVVSSYSRIRELFDMCFDGQIYSSRLVKEIRRFSRERGFKEIGQYSLGSLSAESEGGGVLYKSERIPLTRAEGNIVRYMINSYPYPKIADEILKHVYPRTRAPERSSLRTHISSINKKFSDIFGKRLISLVQGEGYRIGICDIRDEFSARDGI